MPGQRDARPKVTFPVADCHRPLAGTKLYRLMTDAEGANYFLRVVTQPRPTERRTRDLSITIPTPHPLHHHAGYPEYNKYVGPRVIGTKCTLAASKAAPWWVTASIPIADGTDRQTDRRTDARQLHYAFCYGRGQRNDTRIKPETVHYTQLTG